MHPKTEKILRLHDSGKSAAEIAEAIGVTVGRVYASLREHRPDRARKPRMIVSELPARIRGLHARGIAQSRIAYLIGTSRQYVHKVLNEEAR